MSDYSDKGSLSESEDMGSQTSQRSPTPDRSSGTTQPQQPKTCADCGTTKTPLWRGGPAGPKSLCNACGIRSRKRRRALLGLSTKEKVDKKIKKLCKTAKKSNNNNSDSKKSGESTSTSADSTSMVGVYGEGGKVLMFGRDVALQRPRSKTKSNSQRRRLGEEEQAAFLLMALSRGCVYA
ncbi:hypothetical protein LIER_27953 [Lithospermum erythrorhizon]|uniref:GATA-type domain-containing protein n=1 Tax=Lithospermum erythrorhizon TaxID=34254 RepID=A0AAV3RDW9_LITER